MNRKISLFSGIYAPETGGPAKFAKSFSDFARTQNLHVGIFAYSSLPKSCSLNSFVDLFLVSNRISLFSRFVKMVFHVLNAARGNSPILVNGCFWEVAIARHLRKFQYVAKVPGDIVWERMRNNGKTSSNIDSFQNETMGLRTRTLRYFFSYSLRKAEWVIVPSQHLGKLCESWGVQQSKIVEIYNSVLFPLDPDFAITKKKFDFVTVCRLVPWKGVDEVIREVSDLAATLLVIGDGPERDSLQALATSIGADVSFIGEIPSEEVSRYLSLCSTFILNSNFEATSYALLEAQANGLLTISNEGTGSEEVISHNVTGLLCGVNSGISLNQAMKEALLGCENIEKMRTAARLSVEKNFNLEVNYRKILELCIK